MLVMSIPPQKPALRYFSQTHRIYANSAYAKPEIVPVALTGSQHFNKTIFANRQEVVIKPQNYNRLVYAHCCNANKSYPYAVELYGYWAKNEQVEKAISNQKQKISVNPFRAY